MRHLITGGAGFIGSHFIRHMVKKYPKDEFINFDKLTYAGDLERLKDIENEPNYSFIKGDICDLNFLMHILKEIDFIFHFAAETHVDNSLYESFKFTQSNTVGTHIILEASRLNNIKKFIHISTDEVYGDIIEGAFSEKAGLNPTNPYSASKAAAEMIVRGYLRTYNLPIIVVRGNNVMGPFQYIEKIIPKFCSLLLQNRKVPLHGNGTNIRTFIHVEDYCRALEVIFQKGEIGEAYNIGTKDEISNLDLTKLILARLGKDASFIEFVKDRPFNDKRYSVELFKIKSLGWRQEVPFEIGLIKTIDWYGENIAWTNKFLKNPPNPTYSLPLPDKIKLAEINGQMMNYSGY